MFFTEIFKICDGGKIESKMEEVYKILCLLKENKKEIENELNIVCQNMVDEQYVRLGRLHSEQVKEKVFAHNILHRHLLKEFNTLINLVKKYDEKFNLQFVKKDDINNKNIGAIILSDQACIIRMVDGLTWEWFKEKDDEETIDDTDLNITL